jgi:hypothetical protein
LERTVAGDSANADLEVAVQAATAKADRVRALRESLDHGMAIRGVPGRRWSSPVFGLAAAEWEPRKGALDYHICVNGPSDAL